MNPHRSIISKFACGERSGLVVECLTPDRGAAGLSLTIYLSFATGTIACYNYPRECEFGILKEKTKQKKSLAVF